MSQRMRAVAAALAVCCLLAGCQPSASPPTTPGTTPAPPTSPSAMPTPTYMCTPEAGGEAAGCTQAQYDEMKAKDALYAEAEAVYRKFFAENTRISRAGGVEQPTEVMLATSTGAFLEDALEIFRGLAEQRLVARGSDPTITVQRVPGLSREGSAVTLLVCVDASRWAFYQGEQLVSRGRPAEDRIYFSRVEEDLKMSYVEGRWVEKCAEDAS